MNATAEYKVITCDRAAINAYLNDYGSNGWRLAQLVSHDGELLLVLERIHNDG